MECTLLMISINLALFSAIYASHWAGDTVLELIISQNSRSARTREGIRWAIESMMASGLSFSVSALI